MHNSRLFMPQSKFGPVSLGFLLLFCRPMLRLAAS
jgi:hypothetical protein